MKMGNLADLKDAVLNGDARSARTLTERALAEGAGPNEILDNALIPAMEEVGEKFQCGEYYFPEMMVAARAMYEGLNLIRPLLAEGNAAPKGRAVIGTVRGDIHDIGKNIVVMMMEGAGFKVTDLGVNVAPERFVAAAEEERPDFVLMSALITGTMPSMVETIEALRSAGVRERVRIGVGGAPVTQEYADEIGADFFAPDASRAVAKMKTLLGVLG
jgi:5-methyltetrahydrofolate--homocysteine methyltransferase